MNVILYKIGKKKKAILGSTPKGDNYIYDKLYKLKVGIKTWPLIMVFSDYMKGLKGSGYLLLKMGN